MIACIDFKFISYDRWLGRVPCSYWIFGSTSCIWVVLVQLLKVQFRKVMVRAVPSSVN